MNNPNCYYYPYQNCLDRHVEAGNGNRKAIIWEGNNPGEEKTFTYSELLSQVQRFANVLINNGIIFKGCPN